MNRLLIALWVFIEQFAFAKPYHNTAKVLPEPTQKTIEQGAQRVHVPAKLKIPSEWMPYLNPAFEEFWSEGNHKPDAGFMLFARNPTKENAQLWLIRMEAKAKLLQKMWDLTEAQYETLIKKGLIEDRYGMVKGSIASSSKKVPRSIDPALIYFIFSPTCQACKRQIQELIPLKESVLPLQAGKKPLKHFAGFSKSARADAQAVRDYVKSVYPVIIITNPENNKTSVLEGFHSFNKVMTGVSNVLL